MGIFGRRRQNLPSESPSSPLWSPRPALGCSPGAAPPRPGTPHPEPLSRPQDSSGKIGPEAAFLSFPLPSCPCGVSHVPRCFSFPSRYLGFYSANDYPQHLRFIEPSPAVRHGSALCRHHLAQSSQPSQEVVLITPSFGGGSGAPRGYVMDPRSPGRTCWSHEANPARLTDHVLPRPTDRETRTLPAG